MTRRGKDSDPPKFIVQTLPAKPPPSSKQRKNDDADKRAPTQGQEAPEVGPSTGGPRPKRGRPHGPPQQGGEGRKKKQKPAQEADAQVPQEKPGQAAQQAQVGEAQREDPASGQGQHGHEEKTQQDKGPQQPNVPRQQQDKTDGAQQQQGQGPAAEPEPKQQEGQAGQEPAHQATEGGQGKEPDGNAERKKAQLAAARERLSLRRQEKAEMRAAERMLKDQAFQEKKRELAELKAAMLEKQYKEMQEATRKEVEKAELQKRGMRTNADPHYIPAPLPARAPPLGFTPEAKNRQDLPSLETAPEDLEEETKKLYDLLKPRRISLDIPHHNPLTKTRTQQFEKAPRVPDPADMAEEEQANILRMNVQREQEAKATAARIRKEMDEQRKDLLMQQVFGGL